MRKNMDRDTFVESYKGKRVLVIGNTGFKGSWLSLWLLKLGAQVVGYALPAEGDSAHFNLLDLKSRMRCIEGDIRDLEHLMAVFQEVQPEYVFHLAAQAIVGTSYEEPKRTFDTNVGGSVNVLEAVNRTPSVKSFIYVTSDKCYKNKEWLWGYRENDELSGVDPYSASKAAAEIVFHSYLECFFRTKEGIGLSSVRAGNVIGGGDWAHKRIVPDCARALISCTPIEIRSPRATRPWQHVLEPLSGYLTLAALQYGRSNEFSESWNFGPDESSVHTVKELVEGIISHWGSGELIVHDSNDFYECNLLKLSCEKAHQRIGWFPRWDFETTVQETVAWYKAFEAGKLISDEQIEKYMGMK